MPTTLIIGASRGLGLEFTRQLLTLGQNVIATARNPNDLNQLQTMGAQTACLDLSSEESIRTFAERFDAPDLTTIIHNAGVFGSRGSTDVAPSRALFDEVMRTNVYGPMALIPQLAPMVTATMGRYVFVSSDMGSIDGVESSHGSLYRTSKAALNMLVRCAAIDFPQAAFLALSPGWVRTDMGGSEAPLSPEESVAGMIEVIGNMRPNAEGQFRDYANQRRAW